MTNKKIVPYILVVLILVILAELFCHTIIPENVFKILNHSNNIYLFRNQQTSTKTEYN